LITSDQFDNMISVYIQQHAKVNKSGEYKHALCLSITQYI